VVEVNRPKPIDWSFNFSAGSKIPYGCYVLRDVLTSSKPQADIRDNLSTLYESLSDTNRYNENFLIITDEFKPDSLDISKLLDYVNRGNTVFISSLNFSKKFSDTLKFKTDISTEMPNLKSKNKQQFNFTNPGLASKYGYGYEHLTNVSYFSKFDTVNSIVLGQDSYNRVHFIKVSFGKGVLYLHTLPLIFSNYSVLYDNREYPFKTLSYITGHAIVWDEYYKPESSRAFGKSNSPLRYILSQASLRTSYYLLLFTVLLYMIYEGKRRQRIIPIYQKPKNTSKEFVEIVSRLYLSRGDNKNLAEKKILYFYDYISSVYYLKPDENDAKFQHQFAEKSGLTLEKVKQLCNAIIQVKNKKSISDTDLTRFVTLLNKIQFKDFKG
jgi:hypothetical protein